MKNNLNTNNLSLDDKISLAENIIIEEYMKNNGNVFLSFSGGKDSTILRHIALKLFPNIKIVFSDTTNELAEIRAYIKTFPNVITVKPKMGFKKVVKRYGFPLISKEISQKANELKRTNGKRTRFLREYGDKKGNSKLPAKWTFLADQKFNVTHQCCYILKKEPLEKWAKINGNPKPIIALMSDESRLRQQLALYGKDDGKKIYPFLKTGWSEADIWAYAERFNIRFAECYYDRVIDGVLIKARPRTGCEYCMFGIDQEENDRFASSRILTPKRYKSMMNLENNGVTFEEAMKIALQSNRNDTLNLSGGTVRDIEINTSQNKETYIFDITTKDKACKCCSSTKIKDDIKYVMSFIDTPNERRKRVIETHYFWGACENCGMTTTNNLHLFDLRFNVTKRLIDYIYKNIDKKSALEISEETGLELLDVFEIVQFDFNKAIVSAHKNNRDNIWFDEDNQLINAS